MARRMRKAASGANPTLSRRRGGDRGSGVDVLRLRLEDLATPIHDALEVDMMRGGEFAGILVFNVGRGFERIGRAAHAAAGGRSFASGNGHRRNSKSEAD